MVMGVAVAAGSAHASGLDWLSWSRRRCHWLGSVSERQRESVTNRVTGLVTRQTGACRSAGPRNSFRRPLGVAPARGSFHPSRASPCDRLARYRWGRGSPWSRCRSRPPERERRSAGSKAGSRRPGSAERERPWRPGCRQGGRSWPTATAWAGAARRSARRSKLAAAARAPRTGSCRAGGATSWPERGPRPRPEAQPASGLLRLRRPARARASASPPSRPCSRLWAARSERWPQPAAPSPRSARRRRFEGPRGRIEGRPQTPRSSPSVHRDLWPGREG